MLNKVKDVENVTRLFFFLIEKETICSYALISVKMVILINDL